MRKCFTSQKGAGEKINYFEAQDEADEANFIAKTIRGGTEITINLLCFTVPTRSQGRMRKL